MRDHFPPLRNYIILMGEGWDRGCVRISCVGTMC